MKFVILCSFFMALAVSNELTTMSYENCNWILTNTFSSCYNGTNYITTDMTDNESDDQPDDQLIYKTHITITDCDKNCSSCSGESETSIENVNCDDEDFSELGNNACTVAKDVAELEKDQHWLTSQNGTEEDLYNTIFCFNSDDSCNQYN